ncbi:MAG: hypothetical protein HDR27_01420 [Lachnospiraceae bacterium]|nr:hypothetical protein [Lachnospiraceae bacterium]
MERDFEQEFRELKQNEIPDLWNRIEAGLSEKKNTKMISVSEDVIAFDNGARDTKKMIAWRKRGTLIAACVCIVIILPAFSLLIRSKNYSGSGMDNSASAAAEEISCDTAMDAITEDVAAAETAEAVENVAEIAEAETEEGMADNAGAADAGSLDAAASTNEAAAGASADKAAALESTAPEASRKEEEKTVWDDLADGQILEEAVIQIQKAEVTGEEVHYQAVVLQADADDILECERQIALICNADTEYDFLRVPRDKKKLKEQETYQVALRYDAKDEGFVVLAAENWEN